AQLAGRYDRVFVAAGGHYQHPRYGVTGGHLLGRGRNALGAGYLRGGLHSQEFEIVRSNGARAGAQHLWSLYHSLLEALGVFPSDGRAVISDRSHEGDGRLEHGDPVRTHVAPRPTARAIAGERQQSARRRNSAVLLL